MVGGWLFNLHMGMLTDTPQLHKAKWSGWLSRSWSGLKKIFPCKHSIWIAIWIIAIKQWLNNEHNCDALCYIGKWMSRVHLLDCNPDNDPDRYFDCNPDNFAPRKWGNRVRKMRIDHSDGLFDQYWSMSWYTGETSSHIQVVTNLYENWPFEMVEGWYIDLGRVIL